MKGTWAFKLDKPGFECELYHILDCMTLGQLFKLFDSGITSLTSTQGYYGD